MKFNRGKCKVLTVAGKPKPIEFPYRMYGNELSSCKAEKDLGLLVSSKLKWPMGPPYIKDSCKGKQNAWSP
jgi:hypothetical protein